MLGGNLTILALICDVLLRTEEHYSLVDCRTSWRQGIRSVLERIHLTLQGIAGFSTTQKVELLCSITRRRQRN